MAAITAKKYAAHIIIGDCGLPLYSSPPSTFRISHYPGYSASVLRRAEVWNSSIYLHLSVCPYFSHFLAYLLANFTVSLLRHGGLDQTGVWACGLRDPAPHKALCLWELSWHWPSKMASTLGLRQQCISGCGPLWCDYYFSLQGTEALFQTKVSHRAFNFWDLPAPLGVCGLNLYPQDTVHSIAPQAGSRPPWATWLYFLLTLWVPFLFLTLDSLVAFSVHFNF